MRPEASMAIRILDVFLVDKQRAHTTTSFSLSAEPLVGGRLEAL